MTFVFYVLLALGYLLTVAFIFSALFAWWDESAKRKAAHVQLARLIAAQKLARYWHWPACNCGHIHGGLVRLDARCLQWTAAQRRRLELKREEFQKRNEPGASPARKPVSLN